MTARYSLTINGTQIQELQAGDSLLGSIANLTGGVAGTIPWQSASGTTGFTVAGTTGQFLQSNGTSAPTWTTPNYTSPGKAIALSLVFGG